ncbi:MAG TPA: hypothetical protein VK745_16600 [Polyangiaceae bacterium]|jgi:hypothetical protein|nr:hypothetical protein [Polyangiaceae bacterium]
MQISPSAQCLLKLVFTASSSREPVTRPRLERQSGLSSRTLNRALEELEQCGLLDLPRLRLTLAGLAVAVAHGARSRAQARTAARHVRRPSAQNVVSAPIALFSRREAPRAVA